MAAAAVLCGVSACHDHEHDAPSEPLVLAGRVIGGIRDLVIELNTGARATYDAAGAFQFAGLAPGEAYAVTVSDVPPGVACSIAHGSGVAGPDMEPVEITCTTPDPPPPHPEGLQASYSVKAMALSWVPVLGATRYVVLEDPDGAGPLPEAEVASVSAPAYRHVFRALLPTRTGATYRVRSCRERTCGEAGPPLAADMAQAIGYFKASTVATNDQFGYAIALSADGSTLAVGAYLEDGAARGIDGNQRDRSAPDAGAVYVFVMEAGIWRQQAYVKASNTAKGDNFGWSVSLSEDGNVLAVGALREDSAATGVDGDQSSKAAPDAGAAYVFRRSQGRWSQEAYVKASNTDAGDNFGTSVSLSADGETLAIGAFREDGGKPSSDAGAQADNSATDAGAAYVFVHASGTWQQQAYIKASNPGAGDFFGVAVLSGDGRTLAIGAQAEDSAATGVNGDANSEAAQDSGAVYVYERNGSAWSQVAYLKPSNTGAGDNFGIALALSRSGDTLVVGAPREDSNASGRDGDGSDNTGTDSGAAYLFERRNGVWRQEAYLKAGNNARGRLYGFAVALSGDGKVAAVCAPRDNSGIGGIDPPRPDTGAASSGAVHVLRRDARGWTEKSFLKAPHPGPGDQLGGDVFAVGLSLDGTTLAVGARVEDSGTTGIGGDDTNNTAIDSGAVYVY